MKARAVVASARAKADLQWICDKVEAATGSVTALRYVERITAFCQRLEHGGERRNRGQDYGSSALSAGSPSLSSWSLSAW